MEQKLIINCETGEQIEEKLTTKELSDWKATKEKAETEAEAKATQRQAILDRLGLTADEAKLLLG